MKKQHLKSKNWNAFTKKISLFYSIAARELQKDNIDWRAELVKFYNALNMPEKVDDLNNILKSWKGKEDLMLQSLMVKYHEIMPKELELHCVKIMRYIHENENGNDSITNSPNKQHTNFKRYDN